MGWRVRMAMTFALGLLTGVAQVAPAQDRPWTIGIIGNLTTSSQLYVEPKASDPVERSRYVDLTNFFGIGIDLRYDIPDTRIALGLSAERIRVRQSDPLIISETEFIPVEDGYDVVPVELTGYFIIPPSGTIVAIFMGGGVGAYFGQRVYSTAGLAASLLSSRPGFGIHVCTGVAVRFAGAFSVLAEMKFRDLQFSSTNRFPVSRTTFQGSEVILPSGSLDSNVHTDGITFQIGTAFSF
jgi:hypothetical protein